MAERLPFEYVDGCTGPVVDTDILPPGFPIVDVPSYNVSVFLPNLFQFRAPDVAIPEPSIPLDEIQEELDKGSSDGNPFYPGPWKLSSALDDTFNTADFTVGGTEIEDICFWGWRMGSAQDGGDGHKDVTDSFFPNFHDYASSTATVPDTTTGSIYIYVTITHDSLTDASQEVAAAAGPTELIVQGPFVSSTYPRPSISLVGANPRRVEFNPDNITAIAGSAPAGPGVGFPVIIGKASILSDAVGFLIALVLNPLDPGNGQFGIDGNETSFFPPGQSLTVTGSASNNGTYTVVSSTYIPALDTTRVTVQESIPSGVADGSMIPDGLETTIRAYQIQYGQIDARQALTMFDPDNGALVFQHNTNFFTPITQADECP
jgi:hypothetical protein